MFKYLSLFGLLIAVVIAFGVFEHDIPAPVVDARYGSPESRYLTLEDGARIHYRDQGLREAPPLLLIHGSNASLHTWEAWVAALGNEFRVVSLDLPGHGLTGRTPADDYTSAGYVDVVQALVRHLNLPPFALGGNSMGGGVAWRYTLSHPDEVTALILVDASGLPQWRAIDMAADADPASEGSGESPLAFRLLRQGWFQSIARYLDPYYLVSQGLKASYANAALVTESLIDRYYTLNMREGTRAATLRRFSSQGSAADENFDLTSIRAPTLILWGDTDTLISTAVAEKFDDVIPDSTLIIYEHVGHLPMEEVPKRTAADVREFLRRVQLSAATVPPVQSLPMTDEPQDG